MARPGRARAPPARPGFWVEHVAPTAGHAELRLGGTLTFADAASIWSELRLRLSEPQLDAVRIELSEVESIDGGAMALLVQTKWDLQAAGVRCAFAGATAGVQAIIDLYDGDAGPTPRPAEEPVGPLTRVGNGTAAALRELQLAFAYVGSLTRALAGVLRRPQTGNWREIASLVNRTGTDALAIVALINFLIGFAMAFQAAVQLKQFGANIYVADLVGLSVVRELGPLMTAIIVSGRSGAAFAAELGTMKVSEEIDALRTMGFGPLRFLALPRVLALLLVMPVLTLLADLAGFTGGLLVGVFNLDLTVAGYLQQTGRAVGLWDVGQGLLKGAVFGLAIGLVCCYQGLATEGGAAGVGRRTTAAVVLSILTLIVIDAGFTLLFFELRL